MTTKRRKTGGREELDELWARLNSLAMLLAFSSFDDAGIADGTTAGTLKTTASVSHRIEGVAYTKAATDNLWDLSAETDTGAAAYRAYWLYLDSAGAASIGAGDDAASAAAALAALPARSETKSVVGVFVADPSCDFDNAGGLAAQGTIYDGLPEGVPCGVPRHTYTKPELVQLVAP